MAHSEHPQSPDPYRPLVRTGSHDTHPNGSPLAATSLHAAPVSRTPQVVNGAIDASWFFHSLRRRWLLATCMGLLFAGAAGAGLYLLFPESTTARARFLVSSQQESFIYDDLDTGASKDYEIYRATQIAVIKSPTVLQAALRDNPNLKEIRELREAPDPVQWLRENLDVRFEGQSEWLIVSMTADMASEHLKSMVDAVCAAYISEVVDKDHLARAKTRDALAKNYQDIQEEIRQKWDEYKQNAENIGSSKGEKFDPEVRLLFSQMADLQKQKSQQTAKMEQMREEFLVWQNTRNNPQVKEALLDAQMAENQELQIMEQHALALRMQLRDAQMRAQNRSTRETRRIERELQTVQQNQGTLRNRLHSEIKQQEASRPDLELAMVSGRFQLSMQMAQAKMQQLDEQMTDTEQKLLAKAEESTELLVREAELEQLNQVAHDLARRIESWDIEMNAPSRIQLRENAIGEPGINTAQRYAIAGAGGLASFVVTCLGIAYLEFLGRRLNGPKQMDEGLGIPVVGTLPPLNAKRLMNPNHPLVAQLTESIDSVRTALMHDSTSKPRQVVLVTSPAAMEGRTTVASQLAASLARAGRRTLLIDGDLRRPALHSLFDLPLEDGLCEVLRAEAEVSDVVHSTHAEGLWVMTAGYCDADAVQAMATDQIQPIFDKVRADYDFVIIDGAPVLGLSDSLMIGQHADGALLSVLRDHTAVPQIYQAAELLRSVGVRLIGSVVNGVNAKTDRRVTHLQVTTTKAERQQLATSGTSS